MELVLYATIAWLVVAYLVTTIQKKEVVRSIIVYCIYIILTGSALSLLSLNLQAIYLTTDKTKFLSFLIQRDITMPFLTLIFVNTFYRLKGYRRIVPVVLLVLLISIFEYTNLNLMIYSYIKWNFGLALLFQTLYAFIALIIGRCVDIIKLRGEYK